MSLLLHCLGGEENGIYFANSTILKVCYTQRIHNHKVFEGLAQRGKTTLGWFFGLKLHLIINHKGQIMSITIMAIKILLGNSEDRKAL